jgi:hypothetical protein
VRESVTQRILRIPPATPARRALTPVLSLIAAVWALLGAGALAAGAQPWPDRPLRIVVAAPVGNSSYLTMELLKAAGGFDAVPARPRDGGP